MTNNVINLAQYRAQKQLVRDNHRADYDFAVELKNARSKCTKLSDLPSVQIEGHRTYERNFYHERGLNTGHLGYYLWGEAAPKLCHAYRLLTDEDERSMSGITQSKAPRTALAVVSRAIGYRYMRGLEVIQKQLHDDKLEVFNCDRAMFLNEFRQRADAAHAVNAKGQDPGAVLEVLQMFANELLALCPWLESVGEDYGARLLQEGAELRSAGRK